MKLFHSPTSPYVRTVLAVADHHGVTGDIEIVPANPFEDRALLQAKNPLGKVPALELSDGTVLYDSAVIVDFLEQNGHGPSLFKHNDLSPFQIRTLYALSNGVLDAALASVMELRRPQAERSSMWLERWQENILAGTMAMENRLDILGETRILPHLSFAVALDYLMFRLPQIDWRTAHTHLSAWADKALQAEFFQKSDPRLSA